MPYFGVRIAVKESYYLTIKLHGPLDTFVISPQELKLVATARAEQLFGRDVVNIPSACIELADHIKAEYLNGNDLVWVEVEVYNKTNNIFFGASAEKVLIDTSSG